MKVLVTGGLGFVGSHLVDALVTAGYEVIIVDHHRREKPRFPNPLAKVYRLGFGDEAVTEVFRHEQPDAVCHLAAQISVTYSIAEPLADAQRNIVDSVKLMEAARLSGCQRFLFASSGGAIYGDHKLRPTPEVFDAKPLSPYGIAKQAFERYLDFYRQHYGFQNGVLRFSNIYGPRQFYGGEASVVAIFINRLLRDEPVTIFGDGTATRDYLYVADAVTAFIQALENELDGVVNISSETEVSVLELWQKLLQIHGQNHEALFQPTRAGEVERSCLSSRSAKENLNWRATTSLDDGLRTTYDWFKGQL